MAKNDIQLVQEKSLKDKILYPFTVAWTAIKNFFYDISVIIVTFFRKLTGADKRTVTRSVKSRKIGEAIFVWALLAYPLVQFTICYLGVNLNSILLSFKQYVQIDGANGLPTYEWQWLSGDNFFKNFVDFVTDIGDTAGMGIIVSNSFIAYAVSLFIGLPLNLIFSYVIYKKIPAAGFFQVILYLPQMISNVVVSMVFSKFLGESFPNICQYFLGIEGVPKNLLTDPDTVFGINVFYGIWSGFGMQLILYAGAMSRIPDSLIEFGELEGISMLKEFFYVVIPMIYSTITVFLVTGIAGIFTNQLSLYNFYGGGAPLNAKTIGYHYYIMVLGEGNSVMADYPYASASGLLFTLLVAPITLVGRHLLEKYGPNVEF